MRGVETRLYRQSDEGFTLLQQLIFEGSETQALEVFLGSEHEVKISGTFENSLDVSFRKRMMVCEGHELRLVVLTLNMLEEQPGLSDAAEDEGCTGKGNGRISDARKMKLLEGEWSELVVHDTHLDGRHRFGALSDDDRIYLVCTGRQVSKGAPRQHMIIYVQMVISGEKDIQPASDRTMLEGVIKHNHING